MLRGFPAKYNRRPFARQFWRLGQLFRPAQGQARIIRWEVALFIALALFLFYWRYFTS